MTACFDVAAGARDRSPQQFRIGLLQAKGVGAANGGEPRGQAERIEQPQREPFELVRAHRQAAAGCAEGVERSFEPGERPRTIRDMGGIMLDEFLDQRSSPSGAAMLRPSAASPRSIITRAPPPTMLRASS